MKYCPCLYCGKVVGVNPEFCDFCNLHCQMNYQTGEESISSEQWHKNYEESLPAFEEKLKNWRFSRMKKREDSK